MTKQCPPMMLDKAVGEIDPGAIFKHVEDGHIAILVDLTETGDLIVAEVSKKVRKGDELPSKPADYVFRKVESSKDWIVLSLGNRDGFLLLE